MQLSRSQLATFFRAGEKMAYLHRMILIKFKRWGYKLMQFLVLGFIFLVDYSSFFQDYFISLLDTSSYKSSLLCLLNDSGQTIPSNPWTEAQLLFSPPCICLETLIVTLEVQVFVEYPEISLNWMTPGKQNHLRHFKSQNKKEDWSTVASRKKHSG